MPLPESTYRLQFHAGFTFRDATAIVSYLRDLGVTHLYASPYLKARPGSTHGYDVIDPCSLNPELGTPADYDAWVDAMRAAGLAHLLDIVPNHVGVATNENTWWNDVLEHGPASKYANYFDIAWRGSPRPQLHDKVMLPLLGGPYGRVLEKGELKLTFESGAFAVHYYDRRFPLAPRSYGRILGMRPDALVNALGRDDAAVREYRDLVAFADDLSDPAESRVKQRHPSRGREQDLKNRLALLAAASPAVRQFIGQNVQALNGRPGDPRSFDAMDDLLNEQSYRLSYWRVAPDEINYRRFFDINDLAALSMEREEVFRDTHRFILRLVAEGKVDGLRVDHPDGLYDPKEYFERLQTEYAAAAPSPSPGTPGEGRGEGSSRSEISNLKSQISEPSPPPSPGVPGGGVTLPRLYVVAEKILAPDEPLPDDWPVHGTTGYDFLNKVNGLFVDAASEEAFTRLYHEWTGDDTSFDELVYRKKRLILDVALASELQMLAHRLDRFAQKHRGSRDYTLAGLRQALREVIACFPVYRSYVSRSTGVHDADRRYVETAVQRAIERNPKTDPAVFHFVRDVVLQQYAEATTDADRAEEFAFAGKFQQVTAPVTAKGVEDTAFYVYNRFVSLNEVGGEPGHFGVSPDRVHAYFQDRQAKWPHALSALSTHDTKRSEDVRARLNVLSEMPNEWRAGVERWRKLNEPHRRPAARGFAPSPNDEYLLYQTLIGAWPLGTPSAGEYSTFVRRIQQYMEKALREAKVHTTWTSPNEEYEAGVKDFIARILDEKSSREFLRDFRPLQRAVSDLGLVNSLAQTVLKLTAPGVPDTYQGTELWDFSLVDPDNRRPVDYERRRKMLAELGENPDPEELVRSKEDGRVKLLVTSRLLRARRQYPGLFSSGEYLRAEATGPHAENVFAFVRRRGGTSAAVVVPRLASRVGALRDARLNLPAGAMRHLFTDETLDPAAVSVGELFSRFPVAVLLSEG